MSPPGTPAALCVSFVYTGGEEEEDQEEEEEGLFKANAVNATALPRRRK